MIKKKLQNTKKEKKIHYHAFQFENSYEPHTEILKDFQNNIISPFPEGTLTSTSEWFSLVSCVLFTPDAIELLLSGKLVVNFMLSNMWVKEELVLEVQLLLSLHDRELKVKWLVVVELLVELMKL